MNNFYKKFKSNNIALVTILVLSVIILVFALSDFAKHPHTTDEKKANSASLPGEGNKEIEEGKKPEEMQGYYIDDSDGWYYNFVYAPEGQFHGSFTAGYDQSHEATLNNPQKHFSAGGKWTLNDGEIKLYNDAGYQQSMWACDDYIVDSQNYFIGEVPKSKDGFQSSFICRADHSGDTQIMNFYSDGKLIMEIVRDDGAIDSDGDAPLPAYQLIAGIYTIEDDIITGDINGSKQSFYIMDDGIAKWVYHKRVD